jgi:hypothetical protein
MRDLGDGVQAISTKPVVEEIVRIVPDFCFNISRTVCRANRNVDRTFVSIISSYSAALALTEFH